MKHQNIKRCMKLPWSATYGKKNV